MNTTSIPEAMDKFRIRTEWLFETLLLSHNAKIAAKELGYMIQHCDSLSCFNISEHIRLKFLELLNYISVWRDQFSMTEEPFVGVLKRLAWDEITTDSEKSVRKNDYIEIIQYLRGYFAHARRFRKGFICIEKINGKMECTMDVKAIFDSKQIDIVPKAIKSIIRNGSNNYLDIEKIASVLPPKMDELWIRFLDDNIGALSSVCSKRADSKTTVEFSAENADYTPDDDTLVLLAGVKTALEKLGCLNVEVKLTC